MVRCEGHRRVVNRSIHTKSSRAPIQSPSRPRFHLWRPAANLSQLRHESSTSDPVNDEEIAEPTESALSTSLRHLMRSLPHSVVVLTTSLPRYPLPDSETPPGSPQEPMPTTPLDYRAMTLSSFTTLTLTPEPVITFNIKTPSRTLEALSQSRHFLIHILKANRNGMKVADIFTKGNANSISLFLRQPNEVFRVRKVKLNTGIIMPLLKADGVDKVLRCVVMGSGQDGREEGKWSEQSGSGLVRVGDHVLVLGKVEEIMGGGKRWKGGRSGLSYVDGRYRRVGAVIEENKGWEE